MRIPPEHRTLLKNYVICRRITALLIPQNLLDLADLFLSFAGYLFGFALGLQLGIIGDFPGHFLDLTLCFVKRTFHFVLRAGFHDISPFSLKVYWIR
jgi:hypothetical protein